MQERLNEHIAGLIQEINTRIADLDIQGKSLIQARASLQNICRHEFEADGRAHNNIFEKCRICGLTRKA